MEEKPVIVDILEDQASYKEKSKPYSQPLAFDPAMMDADSRLEYTQQARTRMFNRITGFGEDMPDDPKLIAAATRILDGIDKNEIAKKRLVIEDKEAETAAREAELLESVLSRIEERDQFKPIHGSGYRPSIDLDGIDEVKLNPEHLSTTGTQVDLNAIVAEQRRLIKGTSQEE